MLISYCVPLLARFWQLKVNSTQSLPLRSLCSPCGACILVRETHWGEKTAAIQRHWLYNRSTHKENWRDMVRGTYLEGFGEICLEERIMCSRWKVHDWFKITQTSVRGQIRKEPCYSTSNPVPFDDFNKLRQKAWLKGMENTLPSRISPSCTHPHVWNKPQKHQL